MSEERTIVVSNRLPGIRREAPAGEAEVPAGGLASAVFGTLRGLPGAVWVGWSGRTVEDHAPRRVRRQTVSGVELVGLPLGENELRDYYQGYCNETLWPLLHCFQSRVRIRAEHEECYRGVQRRFAETLMSLLRPGDVVWVHDYHLLLLGRELRGLGWDGKIGFFLHTPFPPHELWQLLPDPARLFEGLLHYDLVGFHVGGYRDNYVHCCKTELSAAWDGRWLSACGRTQAVGIYPVGIDPAEFVPDRPAPTVRTRREVLGRTIRDRRLILGVDRLDYTKGIPERIEAFSRLLREHPEWRKRVVFVQIASPSRADLAAYAEQRRRIEALLGRVNGELGEHDWTPIRYVYRTYPREFLAKLYREADVALVTPLRDGMNLVAKEFVAAQYPDSPGVLVLSRTAGAARSLREALLVNPFDASEVGAALHRALCMPVEERRSRHHALFERVSTHTASAWGRTFLTDLGREAQAPGDRLSVPSRRV